MDGKPEKVPYNKGKGRGYAWLKERAGHQSDDCLLWPFSKNTQGYGQLGYRGQYLRAHRLMCEFINGPPPAPDYHAAHTCGNGHMGCVNPRHLQWKTALENRLDANAHGTGNASAARRLTIEQVAEIKASNDSLRKLAAKYGVSFATIGKIKRGDTWVDPRSKLTLEAIRQIREAPEGTAIAVGKSLGVDANKVRRLRTGMSFQGVA